MDIDKIIKTIEDQKNEFTNKYGVEPNVCAISEDVFNQIIEYFNSEIIYADAFHIDKICGMDISVGLKTEGGVQVGYFSKSCRVDLEEK